MKENAFHEGGQNLLIGVSGPCLAIILGALGISATAVTLPELAQDFPTSRLNSTLVVSLYILATTALIVPVGRAGDLFGKRAVLVAGLCLFITGAALAYAAPTLGMLVAARVVQGAGAAAMMAMPMALVRDMVPAPQIGRWMGVMGTMSAIGTASGPALAGAIVAGFGWRAVYLVQIPAALAALALCLACVDAKTRSPHRPEFDLAGASTLALFLASFTFLISELSTGNWPAVTMLLVLAIGSAAAFVAVERKSPKPIIPLTLLRSPLLCTGLATNAMVSLIMIGMLVVGPFFLLDGLGLSTAHMGLVMSIGPISAALSGVPAGRLTERVGARRAVVLGLLGMTCGSAAMAGMPYAIGLVGFILAFVILAPSYQVFLAALNTLVMEDAAEQDRGVTSGVLNLSRNLGFIIGSSTTSAVFWAIVQAAPGTTDPAQPIYLAMAGTFALGCTLASAALLVTVRLDRGKVPV